MKDMRSDALIANYTYIHYRRTLFPRGHQFNFNNAETEDGLGSGPRLDCSLSTVYHTDHATIA